ncbi:MAG: transcriptional regulator [Dermatophilaceae bacterium]|nr:transcriptional regulator [Dermatophilaceae bacterium]
MPQEQKPYAAPRLRVERRQSAQTIRRRRLWVAGLLALAVLGGTAAAYVHLNGNLRTVDLAPEAAGAEGRAQEGPINILVLGSDTRSSAADCKIGGDCGQRTHATSGGAAASGNADVEMLVHVSADRSHASVVSIPRDTVLDLPACRNPSSGLMTPARRDRINSTLQDGPNCTVSAVHRLTGVRIDHFVLVDFAGVVTMSNAIGGVQVCVSKAVYDPYSHLKLSKGSHTLQGLPALEFLRTRHGFGDGSDVGRSGAQHLFLTSMLRKIESAATLTNPVAVYNLADAATKAVTVDTGIGSVQSLTELAAELSKVPSEQIAFMTMPTAPNPRNSATVVPAPSAQALFSRIAADQPLTSPKKKATASSSATPKETGRPSPSPSAGTQGLPPAVTTASSQCASVSRDRSVTLNGTAMSPTRAYRLSQDVPDSAP